MTKVILPWSEYYNLEVCRATIDPSPEELENIGRLDEVVEVQDPQEVADAWYRMTRAAWTPNQDLEEREISTKIIEESLEILRAAAG